MTMPDPDPMPTGNLDAALAYARRGWRVIPIPPGLKYPQGHPAWQREGSTDEAKIRHWWGQAPDHGIGIITGAASGIWALDVDVADGKTGDDTLAEHEAAYGPLPATREHLTGSGGRHILFAWPTDGQTIRNSASGRLGPGLDVRGEGGFIVAPPSIHANGHPYSVEAAAPDRCVQAPGWMLTMLQDPEPAPRNHPAGEARSDRPGDIWAAATSWAQILEPDGWTLHHTDRAGEDHWTRPGKQRRDGTSATTGYKGSDVLKVFTSSLGPAGLDPEGTYTKIGYLAATRHGGDHSAAASALRADGHHGPPSPDLEGLIGASLRDDAPTGTTTAPDEPWPEPIPLGANIALPPFPTHVLPDWIADHAEEVAVDLQVPVDLPALLAIGALSTLCAGHLKLNVRGRWTEHANLYIVIAMPPSTGKSPAYKAMCSAVTELETEHARQTRATVAANQDIVDSIEGELKRAKALDSPDPRQLVDLRAKLFTAQEQPTATPKLTVGDATPEALAKLIADNGGRIAIHSTEGGVFGLMTGRYSDRTNLDVYLQGWSGDRLDTVRVGREANEAPEAILTMVLTVQPSVIRALADTPELAGRGLTARFMYAVPPDVLGHRDLAFRPATNSGSDDRYHDQMMTIGRRMLSWERPATLHLSDPAAQHYSDWRQALERRRLPDGDLRPMAEWTGKLESSVLRLAVLLHVAHGHPHDAPVEMATITQAISVGEYWLTHAAHVHDLWGSSPDIAMARKILDWAEGAGNASFTVRQLYAGNRSAFKRADDTLPPLLLLTERGWIRTVDGGPVLTQRNKRSVEFALHPELSTVSARYARSRLRGEKEDHSLSFLSKGDGRPPAQNAQNAQNDATTDRDNAPPSVPVAIDSDDDDGGLW